MALLRKEIPQKFRTLKYKLLAGKYYVLKKCLTLHSLYNEIFDAMNGINKLNQVLIFTEMNNTKLYHDADTHETTCRNSGRHNASWWQKIVITDTNSRILKKKAML